MSNKKHYCEADCRYLVKGLNTCMHPELADKAIKLRKDFFGRYEKVCEDLEKTKKDIKAEKIEKLLKKNGR